MTKEIDFDINLFVTAAKGMKAFDITILDVRGISPVTDYFIICSGRSNRQVTAICEFIKKDLKYKGIKPVSIEGIKDGQWALVDYGHVIVHVFLDVVREFYNIEGLWLDAKKITISDNNGEPV
jgi:ribosome-associated protein